jgi:hypothetical protein
MVGQQVCPQRSAITEYTSQSFAGNHGTPLKDNSQAFGLQRRLSLSRSFDTARKPACRLRAYYGHRSQSDLEAEYFT